MFSRLHGKLGTAGLIVAIVALVAALTGAAFAAGGLTKQQEKQVKKIAKKYAGKRGKRGPAGPAGAQGPAGAPGAKGDAGAKGDKGDAGERGPEGPEGPEGLEGSPWTAGGVLPSGETETGAWSYNGAEEILLNSVSFPIPLELPPLAEIVAPSATTANCKGSESEPSAEPGYLCVYVDALGIPPKEFIKIGTWGATMLTENTFASNIFGLGSFAVTAE